MNIPGKRYIAVAIAAGCLTFTAPLSAEEAAAAPAASAALTDKAEVQEIFDFFQKEAEVYVISKTKGEKVSQAPGSARVWTRRELQSLGINTLKDLAGLTSGYSNQFSFGQYGYNVRGQASNIFNNNGVLLLIDGVPVNTARANRAFNEEELPLVGVERVEMLKGPSSALYGTGAFLGVINVVTRDLNEPGQAVDVQVSMANPVFSNQVQASAIFRDKDLKTKVLAGYFDRVQSGMKVLDGFSNPGAGVYHESQFDDKLRAHYLNASLEVVNADELLYGLKVGAILMERTGGFGVLWFGFTTPADTTTFRNFIPYVEYKRPLGESLSLNLSAVQQYNDEYGLTTSFAVDALPGSSWREASLYSVPATSFQGKAELTWQIVDSASLVAGLAYDERTVKGSPDQLGVYFENTAEIKYDKLVQVGPFETQSAYLQLKKDWELLAGLDTIAGVRYDKGLGFEQFSPRAGVVQKLNEEMNLKVLYGSALIAPGTKELDQNQQAQAALNAMGSGVTVPNVQAQRSQSLEGAFVYRSQQVGASATYFYMVINNLFTGYNVLGQNIMGNSTGNNYSRGVELETDYMLKDAKLFAAFTAQETVDNNGDCVAGVPTRFGSLGAIYDLKASGTTLGTTARWMGDISRGTVNAFLPDMLAGYTQWDLNLGQRIAANTNLELKVANLADASYGLAMSGVADAPQARRTYTLSVRSSF